jgi:threonine synthase
VPVGDGVIISGIYKGFVDLLNLGIINKMPVVVAVQSERSDNLVRNLTESDFRMVGSTTIADSISVYVPRNFYMAREFIRLYHGEAITVSDEDIIASLSFLARNTGLFVEPAAAASFAGYLKYIENHKIEERSANLLLLTGSGLKDLKSVNKALKMPVSIYPELDSLQKFIENIPDF